MRTLTDFNNEYIYNQTAAASAPKPKTKASVIKNTAFYSVLVIAVALAFIYSGNSDGKRFGPFGYANVLTESMSSVYPKGSIVFSWAVDPDEALQAGLDNGTDIVFTKKDGIVVVHRIIEIMKNYDDSGQRAFKTQGVDNPAPDPWITYEGNVIGRVTKHVPIYGKVLNFIADNILIACIAIVLLFGFYALLEYAFGKIVIYVFNALFGGAVVFTVLFFAYYLVIA